MIVFVECDQFIVLEFCTISLAIVGILEERLGLALLLRQNYEDKILICGHVCVCMCMYVCVYVYLFVCIYVCMYV